MSLHPTLSSLFSLSPDLTSSPGLCFCCCCHPPRLALPLHFLSLLTFNSTHSFLPRCRGAASTGGGGVFEPASVFVCLCHRVCETGAGQQKGGRKGSIHVCILRQRDGETCFCMCVLACCLCVCEGAEGKGWNPHPGPWICISVSSVEPPLQG